MLCILVVFGRALVKRPVITVLGPNPLMVDINKNGDIYEDQGALCNFGKQQETDKVIVSGDKVQLSRPDVYGKPICRALK